MSKSFSPSTICVKASPPIGDLHDRLDVGHVDPVAGAEAAVDLDLEVGLADDVKQPTFSIPWTALRMLVTRCPGFSSSFRSVPKSLIELAPLTPERASSTLSRMYCEKLKLIARELLELLHQLLLDLLAA